MVLLRSQFAMQGNLKLWHHTSAIVTFNLDLLTALDYEIPNRSVKYGPVYIWVDHKCALGTIYDCLPELWMGSTHINRPPNPEQEHSDRLAKRSNKKFQIRNVEVDQNPIFIHNSLVTPSKSFYFLLFELWFSYQ